MKIVNFRKNSNDMDSYLHITLVDGSFFVFVSIALNLKPSIVLDSE